MSQSFTSKATSINSNKLPTVYSKAKFRSRIILDYGCGKYIDHIRNHLLGKYVYLPYDPYNQPEDSNKATRFVLALARANNDPVDVVCSNVLNVIDDLDTVRQIAKEIEEIVTTSGGTGYITVYEGNRSGIGKQTGADQFQRNEPLRSYLQYFRNATIKNGMIIVSSKSVDKLR